MRQRGYGNEDTTGWPVGVPNWTTRKGNRILILDPILLNPNPPMDTDGRRENSGRGVRELQGRWSGLHWGRSEVGGGSSVVAQGPYGRLRTLGRADGWERTQQETLAEGLARVGGDVRLSVGWLRHRRCRQAGSGIARSRARARLNCSSQGQRRGRCRVNRRAERVSRPAREKNRRRRVLVVTIC